VEQVAFNAPIFAAHAIQLLATAAHQDIIYLLVYV